MTLEKCQNIHGISDFYFLTINMLINDFAFVVRKADFAANKKHYKGADQPEHPHSLISASASCKVLIFLLVSVAEQAGLSLTWLQI